MSASHFGETADNNQSLATAASPGPRLTSWEETQQNLIDMIQDDDDERLVKYLEAEKMKDISGNLKLQTSEEPNYIDTDGESSSVQCEVGQSE